MLRSTKHDLSITPDQQSLHKLTVSDCIHHDFCSALRLVCDEVLSSFNARDEYEIIDRGQSRKIWGSASHDRGLVVAFAAG